MADAGFTIKGIPEFQKFLKVLPDRLARRVSRQALKASATPIIQRMKSNLAKHERTGALRKSIRALIPSGKFKARRFAGQEVVVLVGAIKGKNVDFLNDGFYARFLEVGTSKQPPRPWAKPAVESGAGAQQRKLGIEFGRRALKEVRRQARKIIGVT